MRKQRHLLRVQAAVGVLWLLALAGCRGNAPAQIAEQGATAGPPTVEVVKVVEQPLNVTLSLPGELTPYQTVALYSRVTGFVKSITVDRGSRVRAGQQLATLEAPELVAQRSEAQSKLQSAEAQLAAIRAKADASASTYEKLKAASATPGVGCARAGPRNRRRVRSAQRTANARSGRRRASTHARGSRPQVGSPPAEPPRGAG